MKEQDLVKHFLVFSCRSGSHAYGTSMPHSDVDTRGVFIAPPEYTLGCMKTVKQVKVQDSDDHVVHELAHFMRLAADCNPNIIELLFTDDDDILFIDPVFAEIRQHRHLFLSKKAKFTFSGYAHQQLKRIQGHHRWINDPQPEAPPALLDFAKVIWTDGRVGSGMDALGLLDIFLVKINATTFRIFSSPKFSKPILSECGMNIQFVDISEEKFRERAGAVEFRGVLIAQIDTFRSAHKKWKEYWQWKKNRNPARSELEEKHGFDTKHASHLMRLLYMAHEILTEGKVIVRRPNAEELLAIRNGKFEYNQLVRKAEEMDAQLDELYEKSTLPHGADKKAINELFMRVVYSYWERHGLLKFPAVL